MTYKFQQIKPQKARGTFREELWTDPAWSAENKFDGDRRIAQFCRAGPIREVRFTGSKESVHGGYVEKSTNLPHLSDFPLTLEGTVLDGEIVAPWAMGLPGGQSKWVTSIMGSKPERAIQLQKERGWLEYRVFDCLAFKGMSLIDEPLAARRDSLAQILKIWSNPYAKMVTSHTHEEHKRMAWQQSEEGLIFKHQDHTYGDERLWVKLKKVFTADVIILGFMPGAGKYAGSVGAIKFGQWTGGRISGPEQLGTCRGFSDSQMDNFTMHPKKYIGKVIEIKHYGREPTGAFRHPQFKRFRSDKNPADCVYNPEET